MAPKKGNQPIQFHTIRYAPPPVDLPVYGSASPEELCVLGRTNYVAPTDGQRYVYGILAEDRLKHMQVIGKSGSGKTKFIESMIRQDLTQKHPVVLFDSSGEAARSLVSFLPQEQKAQARIIGLAGYEGINVMPQDESGAVTFIDTLIAAAEEYFGEKFPHDTVANTRAAYLSTKPGTFPGLVRTLTSNATTKPIATFITELFADGNVESLLTGPPLGKELRNEGALTIVALHEHILGSKRTKAVTALITDALLRSASYNKDPLYWYIDGAQVLPQNSGMRLVDMASSQNIALTVTHRYYSELDETFMRHLSTVTGTQVFFRLGGDDASRARQEALQSLDARDFLILRPQQYYIRLSINGIIQQPFSAEALTLTDGKGK